jgi:hypothetical protein
MAAAAAVWRGLTTGPLYPATATQWLLVLAAFLVVQVMGAHHKFPV